MADAVRVSDAQCLAAANASENTDDIVVMRTAGGLLEVFNTSTKKVLHRTTDPDEAKMLFQIEFFRPLIEAALNVV